MKTAEANIKEKIERWEKLFAEKSTGDSVSYNYDAKPNIKPVEKPISKSFASPGVGFLDIQILKSIGGVPEPAGHEAARALLSRIKRNAQYMVDLVRLDLASQEDLFHIAKNIALDAEQIAVSSARFEKRDVLTFAGAADID